MAHDQLIASTFGFFSSGTWTIVRNVAVLLVLVFWIAIAVWVYKDARRRIEDPWLVVMATLIGQQTTELLNWPFAGALSVLLLGSTLLIVIVFRNVLARNQGMQIGG